MAGKQYEERRRKLQLEEQQRAKADEDRVLAAGRNVGLSRGRSGTSVRTQDQPVVEDRLQGYYDKYLLRRQERMKEEEQEELSQLRSPQIDRISERIVSSMTVRFNER